MSNYGIKISFSGKDVTSAGLKDLIFHSKYPFLKIKYIGTGSVIHIDGGKGEDILVYTHNLGYNPFFLFYSQYYDAFSLSMVTSYSLMPYALTSSGGLISNQYIPYTNSTELRYSLVSWGGDGLNHTINFMYIIYYDPI